MLIKAIRNFWSLALRLTRNYVGRAGPLLSLSDLVLNLLAFVERSVAGRLDFGMVDK